VCSAWGDFYLLKSAVNGGCVGLHLSSAEFDLNSL
jgi:hypothetical protein